MKTIKYTTALKSIKYILTVLVFFTSSCKKYLDKEPRDALSDQFVNEAIRKEGIDKVLNTLYWSLNPRWAMEDASNWMFIEALSDNSNSGGDDDAGYRKTAAFEITPDNGFSNRWAYYYKVIVESNKSIHLIYTIFDAAGISPQMAEAKFYRAWAYFELGRSFGGVMVLDENALFTDPVAKTRKTLDETYDFAINDLLIAADKLPDERVGCKPSKWTAKALLGKIYLYKKDWAKAKEQLMAVVNNGSFILEPNYSDVFQVSHEKSKEMVFSIDCTDQGLADWGNSDWMLHGNQLFAFCGPLVESHKDYMDGWGYSLPTTSLADAFDAAGDTKRKQATLLTISELKMGVVDDNGDPVDPTTFELPEPTFGWEGYYCRKTMPLKQYKSSSGEHYINYPQDYIIMRYSEVLLLAAEACLQSGAIGEGQPLLNQVRNRVSLPVIPLTIDNLLKDKRLELAMEGERFFDLVRYNKASEVLGSKGFTANKNEIFPIPQGEIDKIGPTLLQNPGY